MMEWLASCTYSQIASGFYLFALFWVALCLGWGHRTGKINLWEIVTATDRHGLKRTDGRKLFEAGAFVVMTLTFCLLSILGRMTEWYAFVYVGAWVAARGLRDAAQIRQQAIGGSAQPPQGGTVG